MVKTLLLLEINHSLSKKYVLGKVNLVLSLVFIQSYQPSLELLDSVYNLENVDLVLSKFILLVSKFVYLCFLSLSEAI